MEALTDREWQLWRAWKQAAEAVRSRMLADVGAATGLSDPDFAILTRVTDAACPAVRQNELASAMGWHRSRLSHQLTRMEQRGLVTRTAVAGGVEVAASQAGRDALHRARPLHAAAVRRHLTGLVPEEAEIDFLNTLTRLAATDGEPGAAPDT